MYFLLFHLLQVEEVVGEIPPTTSSPPIIQESGPVTHTATGIDKHADIHSDSTPHASDTATKDGIKDGEVEDIDDFLNSLNVK